MLISPLLASHPLIPSSPPLVFLFAFSHVASSPPNPINPSYNLYSLLSCSSFIPIIYFPVSPTVSFSQASYHRCSKATPPPPPPFPTSLLPYTSISASISGVHSGWRRPTQSSQGAEGLSTPTQALRHGTQKNRQRRENRWEDTLVACFITLLLTTLWSSAWLCKVAGYCGLITQAYI